MKVLFVFSGNSSAGVSPFVKEQAESLERIGVRIDFFPIVGRGIAGYIQSALKLRDHLRNNTYDLIHGHFIWSVIVCALQKNVPVVGTFHGTDITTKRSRMLAKYLVIPIIRSAIVVNESMARMLSRKKVRVIPCGIDTEMFHRTESGNYHDKSISPLQVKILFSSTFSRYEKNYPLAKQAISLLGEVYSVDLIELKGYSREQVRDLMNEVDLVLLTSLWEGSPQVVKEAMACNCPVVTTNVGDVRWLLDGVGNCHICGFDAAEIASRITEVLSNGGRSNGRARIFELGLDLPTIASRVLTSYREAIGS